MIMSYEEIKDLLNEKSEQYNQPDFIHDDPISIPHMFSGREDMEISGFLSATIAWGQRPVIIRNAITLVKWMDYSPYEFIMNSTAADIEHFKGFKHRTFNGDDCVYFIRSLQNIYKHHGGLENVFTQAYLNNAEDIGSAIHAFRDVFFSHAPPGRTKKHVADPLNGSSAKRINMFLRWMVRNDDHGVDFGLWNDISPASLCCPLDVHTGNVARGLGIIKRNANDWKAVVELTNFLKTLDPRDPAKYDFALFGLGMYESL